MQSYVLQAFEIVATTGVERRHSNRSSPAGLEHRKKSHPSDDSFFYLFESTRRRRTSGGRSTATTAAERRHSNRSNPAGLEYTKKEVSNGYLLFCIIESTRRDSNPRPSPWQGDTPPLSHSCVSGYHHDSMDLLKCQDKKSVVYCGGYEKIYWSGQHMEVKERKKHWKHQ